VTADRHIELADDWTCLEEAFAVRKACSTIYLAARPEENNINTISGVVRLVSKARLELLKGKLLIKASRSNN
jgi:hypothetical protein